MGLTEYRCTRCKDSFYAFPEDEQRIAEYKNYKCTGKKSHKFEALPPLVRCVHMTEIFMLSQLDSVHTIHELNSRLMREAADDREVKMQNLARKEL